MFDIGSARNTPELESVKNIGRKIVRGITKITFRRREKHIEGFAFPSAMKVDWPENCNAIKTYAKKKYCRYLFPTSHKATSSVKIEKKNEGKSTIRIQITAEYTNAKREENLIPCLTRSNCPAP